MNFADMQAAIAASLCKAFTPPEPVARTVVGGVTVSTVFTHDCGYETAIVDANDAHPVERYADRESAARGHQSWTELVPSLKEIDKLGHPGFGVEAKRIKLQRAC